MNSTQLNQLFSFKEQGFKFTHLSGQEMHVTDGKYISHIVSGTTSHELYLKCFALLSK